MSEWARSPSNPHPSLSELGVLASERNIPTSEGETSRSEHGTSASKLGTLASEHKASTSEHKIPSSEHEVSTLELYPLHPEVRSRKAVSQHACEKPRSPVRLFLSTKKYPQLKRHLEAASTAPGD